MHRSQGQSRATIDKERRIGSLLSISMRIAGSKFGGGRYSYFHLDANAGSGWNDEVDVPGSPTVFWDLAEAYLSDFDMPFSAFLAERHPGRAAALLKRSELYAHCSFVFPRDNEEVLAVFAQFIRERDRPDFAVGTVLLDPNGWGYRSKDGEGAPVTALIEFAKEFPRIDIAMNLNARIYRLQRAQGHLGLLEPEALMHALGKDHWLVSYAHYGGNDYLLAVGRNVSTGDHIALGMYTLASQQGRHIINLVEGRRQGSLFDAGL